MALPIEFHPEARAELEAAIDWYDAERRGLGTVFATAVRDASMRAATEPLTGGPVGATLYRMFVQHFPYAVLYAIEEHRVFILAVAHFRRRPGYWRRRY